MVIISEPAEGTSLVNVRQFRNDEHFQNRDPYIMEDSQGQLCMIYQTFNGSAGGADVYFVRTTDGTTWGEPVLVDEYDWKDDAGAMVEGEPGHFYMPHHSAKFEVEERSWNVYFIKSEDYGATWSEPIFVADDYYWGEVPFGIAVKDSNVWILWKRELEVFVSRSTDGGETWGDPFPILNGTIVGKGSIIVNQNEEPIIAISNSSNGDLMIFRTPDGGATWEMFSNSPLSVPPYTMNLVQDADGDYWLAFDSMPYGDEELYLTRSSDLVNWNPAERLTTDPRIDWDVSIVCRESGVFTLVWERGETKNATGQREIYIAEIYDPKLTLELLTPRINYVAEQQNITVQTRLSLKGGMVHNLSLDLVDDHGLTTLVVDETLSSASIDQDITLNFSFQVPVDPLLRNFQLKVRANSDETLSVTETLYFDYLFLNLSTPASSLKHAAPGGEVTFSFKVQAIGGTIDHPQMVLVDGDRLDHSQSCLPQPNLTDVDEGVCTITFKVPANATVGEQFQLTIVVDHELGSSNPQVLTINVVKARADDGWLERLIGSGPQLASGVILAVIVVALLGMWNTPKGQERLWPFIFPLYARIRKEKVMDNLMRGQIMEYIRENPACTVMDLLAQADVSRNAMLYHLSVLSHHGFIQCRPYAGFRHYYPTGERMTETAKYTTPAAEHVHKFIAVNPGLTIKQLTALTCTTKQAVRANILRLQLDNRVRWKRQKRVRQWFAVED